MKLLLIGSGGALGAVLRYWISGWVQSPAKGAFPFGVLAVNLLGCLLIGVLAESLVREEHRLLLLAGFLGSFTTFSTFGWETLQLAERGHAWLALANVLASNVLGLACVFAGQRLARELL